MNRELGVAVCGYQKAVCKAGAPPPTDGLERSAPTRLERSARILLSLSGRVRAYNMGCVASSLLLVMVCANGCDIGGLQSKFSFPPPQASYALKRATSRDGENTLEVVDEELRPTPSPLVTLRMRYVRTSRSQEIAVFHFIHEAAELTLLWSHGNAMDCGEILVFLQDLSLRLGVSVVVYDYAGYGASSGRPSEASTYADIEAVHGYLNGDGGVPDEKLVVVGQSVGSGPSLWLVERHRGVRGLWLQSSLLSGLRVLAPDPICSLGGFCGPPCAFGLCDIFPNLRRVRRVHCPVLIMHGTHDDVIHPSHSEELHRLCPARYLI